MVAMNDGTGLQYFPSTSSGHRLTDHLGSVVATTDSNGTLTSQQRYLPFGGVRTDVPSPNTPATDYGYTGQRNLDPEIGLMDYKARFYSPYINRFIQPDTLILKNLPKNGKVFYLNHLHHDLWPVLQRLRQMCGLDLFTARQVCNCSR